MNVGWQGCCLKHFFESNNKTCFFPKKKQVFLIFSKNNCFLGHVYNWIPYFCYPWLKCFGQNLLTFHRFNYTCSYRNGFNPNKFQTWNQNQRTVNLKNNKNKSFLHCFSLFFSCLKHLFQATQPCLVMFFKWQRCWDEQRREEWERRQRNRGADRRSTCAATPRWVSSQSADLSYQLQKRNRRTTELQIV